jgi:hypothetical protein
MTYKKTALLAAMVMCCGTALLTFTPTTFAYPQPAIVSPTWALDFSFANPRTIAVTEIDGNVRWYWYMPYMVVNNTGEDRLFIPEITIADDSGRIITAGQDVPASVFKAVQNQLGNPLLKSSIAIVGKLLQGEDYAQESVAIWPVSPTDVDEFSVFISGLSGESQTIPNPATGEDVLVRRTLMLTFATPGNPVTPQDQSITLQSQRDVMR